jgi:hypothetical protein
VVVLPEVLPAVLLSPRVVVLPEVLPAVLLSPRVVVLPEVREILAVFSLLVQVVPHSLVMLPNCPVERQHPEEVYNHLSPVYHPSLAAERQHPEEVYNRPSLAAEHRNLV